jgi:hypothetical protein
VPSFTWPSVSECVELTVPVRTVVPFFLRSQVIDVLVPVSCSITWKPRIVPAFEATKIVRVWAVGVGRGAEVEVGAGFVMCLSLSALIFVEFEIASSVMLPVS